MQQKALIALHGRGSTSADILQLAQELTDSTFYLAAPQAAGNQWYPLNFMEEESANEPDLSSSVKIVKNLIDEIGSRIPKNQIYLMGFSQGACLALETAARYAEKYGGVIAFSGGLIGDVLNEKKYHGDFKGTPIFIGISDNDPHVPLSRAKESKTLLEKMGAHVTLNIYQGMGHTLIEEEIDWVKANILFT